MERLCARRREAPFVIGALVVWALVFALLPYGAMPSSRLAAAAAGFALFAVVVVWAAISEWHPAARTSPWWPPFALLGVSACVMHSLADPRAGFAPMTLLPVVWLALYGSRRQVLVAVSGVLVLATIWATQRLDSLVQARPALVWLAVSGLVGWAVQGVVRERGQHAAALTATHAALRAVSEIAHNLGNDRDVRRQICDAACDIADASYALLVESDGAGRLSSIAATDQRLVGLSVDLDAPDCGISTAFRTGQRQVIERSSAGDVLSTQLAAITGARSILFEPVRSRDTTRGVLVVVFTEQSGADELALQTVEMLAVEAGLALSRADLVTELARQAETDQLTGLANRRTWDRELEVAMRRAASSSEPLCIAIIDLDNFKAFNDTFGHEAGDRLLRSAASEWTNQLRNEDLLARFGGEEFTVLLAGCTEPMAQTVAGRLRAVRPFDQTLSVGIARWNGIESAAMLLRRADKALYEAKASGRDRVVCAV